MSVGMLIRKPSAFLPIAMSLGALGVLLAYVAAFGVARQADEGLAAHVYQLLLVAEVPIVVYFAVRWLPLAPTEGLLVLVLQIGAVLVTLLPLYVLGF